MVCFDVQTTGIDMERDRIVTAAVCRVGANIPTTDKMWHVNPGIPIPEESVKFHGVTNRAAETYPPASQAVAEILGTLEDELSEGHPLVVFNARFDLTILDREARRHHLVPLTDRLDVNVIDPLVIDRAMDKFRPGKRTLEAVARQYRVKTSITDSVSAALTAGRVAYRLSQKFEILKVSPEVLHRSERTWAAEQAASLQEYFDRKEINQKVSSDWPLIPEPALV